MVLALGLAYTNNRNNKTKQTKGYFIQAFKIHQKQNKFFKTKANNQN